MGYPVVYRYRPLRYFNSRRTCPPAVSILYRAIITRGAIDPGNLLLGTDFLKRVVKVSIDFADKKVGLRENTYPMVAKDQEPGTGNAKILRKRDVRQVIEHLAHTIQVPAYFTVDVELDDRVEFHIEGISSLSGVRMDRELVDIVKGKCKVRLSNEEGETAKVTPELCTIIAHEGDADIEVRDEQPDCTAPDLQHLGTAQQLEVGEVLKQNKRAFSLHQMDLRHCTMVQHRIDTGKNAPVATRQWPLLHSTRQAMYEEVEKMV